MKSREEILGTFQGWSEGFLHRFKRKVKSSELIDSLLAIKTEKEIASIKETFSTWHPEELRIAIDLLKKDGFEFIEAEAKKNKGQ